MARLLTFSADDDDMDVGAGQSSRAFDPELDDSRDGLPLLLKQTRLPSAGMAEVAEEEDENAGDAVMENSRDRGTKRKASLAPAPTPRNSPQKDVGAHPSTPSVWTQSVPALTRLFGLETKQPPRAVVGGLKEEGVLKKQKVSQTVAVATQTSTPSPALPSSTAAFIAPVVKRVTRTTWKRINDAAAAPSQSTCARLPLCPPSPALTALNSVAAAKKKRVVVTAKQKAAAAQSAAAAVTQHSPAITAASSSSSSSSASTSSTPSSPTSSTPAVPPPPPSPRTVAHRLAQRRKQLDLGKRTEGYQRYIAAVPRKARQEGVHPQTPQPRKACSKRSWDGQVRKWRRELHKWDPEGATKAVDDGDEEGQSELGSELASELSHKGREGESELGSEVGTEMEPGAAAEAEPGMVDSSAAEIREQVKVAV